MEIEPGDLVEIRRLLLESISVERQEPGEPADDLLGEPESQIGQSGWISPASPLNAIGDAGPLTAPLIPKCPACRFGRPA